MLACHVTGSRHVNNVVEAETVAVGAGLTEADGELATEGVSTAAGVARLVQPVITNRINRTDALMPAATPMRVFPLLADGIHGRQPFDSPA